LTDLIHQGELKDRLRSHLIHLIRERDPYLATQGHFYVQQYIQQELSQWGTVTVQPFQVRGMSLQNLVLDLPTPPQSPLRPPILIGAHYDAVPNSPGADDNATGVAVLLELARWFSAVPPRYPIRLVAFDFEETSYELAGSTYYALSLQQTPLRLMIALEMLGYRTTAPNSQQYPAGLQYFYPNQGDFIGFIGNLKTIPDLLRLSRAMRKTGTPSAWLPAGHRGMIVPATRRSDHAVFWDLGYRALMVTDTSFLRNPHYHLPSDRLETLDLEFLTGICQGLAMGIQQL
jgi:Zn-dependent M28 family amino/carboxypeptidase